MEQILKDERTPANCLGHSAYEVIQAIGVLCTADQAVRVILDQDA